MKLFIHGVPNTGHMWAPLISALGLAEGDYQAPTMPGFDGRLPPGFDATKEDYLAWLVGTLETTAAAHGPVDLVGHDWGAPLAGLAAQARPELIRSWAIINAAPEPTFKWHKLAKTWQAPVKGELFMLMGTRAKFEQALTRGGIPAEVAAHEAAQIGRAMKRSILKLYRSARDPREWAADFSAIADRGLLLWGAGDTFVPVKYGQTFADRWGIKLVAEEGVGHWGICERPEAFAAHLAAHWAQQGG